MWEPWLQAILVPTVAQERPEGQDYLGEQAGQESLPQAESGSDKGLGSPELAAVDRYTDGYWDTQDGWLIRRLFVEP